MKRLLILALALGLSACMNSEDHAIDSKPGQLQLVAMKGLAKVSTSSPTSDSSTGYLFDLDTANASISQYFLIQNTGDYEVKHLKLTTNNPHFYFTPSEIDVVPPSKTSSLQQLVKLSVIHGTQINGVGAADQLPKGLNSAVAQLAGTTSNSRHDLVAISQTAQFEVYAKVFDVDFFGFDTVPVLMSRNNFNGGKYGGISGEMLRGYYAGVRVNDALRLSTPTLKIVNSGNSSFKVTVYYSIGDIAVASDSMEVADGASYTVPFGSSAGAPLIMIDGHGVVAKSEKLWLQASVNAATNGKFVGIFFPSNW